MTVSEKLPAELKKRKLSSKQLQLPKILLGQLGEQDAVSYLISQDYTIVQTNVSSAVGELDIIAFDSHQHELVFCEVKTRSTEYFGHASTAITWKKRLALQKIALKFLESYPNYHNFRFDLITICQGRIQHYQNCFL